MKRVPKKTDSLWREVTIYFNNDPTLSAKVWTAVALIEKICASDILYFARYSSPTKLVIKIRSLVSPAKIRNEWQKSNPQLICAEVMPEAASATHALAYQIVKASRTQPSAEKQDQFIGDVMHWLMNMRGHAYLAEAQEYIRLGYFALANLRSALGENEPKP